MSAKKKVLLVDDDCDFVEISRRVLETKGYTVLCARDPQDALTRTTRDRPDLVITDLMMGGLAPGFSFTRQIREDAHLRDIPVIIATAINGQPGVEFTPRTPDDLAAMHAAAFFDKPVAPEALLAKVEELLAQQRNASPTCANDTFS